MGGKHRAGSLGVDRVCNLVTHTQLYYITWTLPLNCGSDVIEGENGPVVVVVVVAIAVAAAAAAGHRSRIRIWRIVMKGSIGQDH